LYKVEKEFDHIQAYNGHIGEVAFNLSSGYVFYPFDDDSSQKLLKEVNWVIDFITLSDIKDTGILIRKSFGEWLLDMQPDIFDGCNFIILEEDHNVEVEGLAAEYHPPVHTRRV
jgi:hypothetical protein